ncbi:uncharacterized protein LOC128292709 [Gossypium arboreum]|uniref:uncharacterized protein LOC128292709 n=1 Tax=Gossypium arboreum TaxID=29729 RepID=UPI0022F1D4CF|nr:uncharacterized protein LOC128292709 [Gossypium arboreum]
MPNLDTSEMLVSPATETGSQSHSAGDNKLKGAVFLLREVAYQWWLTAKEGTQPDRLTWELFKTTFQNKYVGASYVDACKREFLNLTQGDQSVAEYEAKFFRFSYYARGMVASEYERCKEREFTVLVEKAKIVEDVKYAERQNRGRERDKNKRDSEPLCSVKRPKKKASSNGPVRVRAPISSIASIGLQPCSDCGRHHPGSIHSYIASNVFETLGISVESTTSEVTVLSLLGLSVRVSKIYRNVPLVVQGTIFLMDLMDLLFGEFDIILGMDWLVKHQVSLNCATKKVVLRTGVGNEVVVIGERRDYFSNVISALMAEKLV